MKKIGEPHVFISYAWGSEEYQRKVIQFASSLLENHIDVELDKWSLKEGNDTYAYMEKEVLDCSITNVLLLIDKVYTEKANSRTGGVGTETQIISPEIYGKTEQEKFIPIVFERGDNGEIFKPAYLKSRLHFDLSQEDKYEDEFKRLVRRLFGVETIAKPKLGAKPDWIDKQETIINPLLTFSKINKITDKKQKNKELDLLSQELMSKVVNYPIDTNDNKSVIEKYLDMRVLIHDYLTLINTYYYMDEIEKYFTETLEKNANLLDEGKQDGSLKRSMLHELLIYVIAIFYKKKEYKKIGYILSKSYFKNGDNAVQTYVMFYTYNQALNVSMCNRDNKQYFSGMAELWMEKLFSDICSKQEFVLADVIMFNYSMMINYNNVWFPVLYCYEREFSSLYTNIVKHCKSKEYLESFYEVFDCKGIDEFKMKIKNIETNNQRNSYRIRYPGCWNDAPLIIDYIKEEEIGKSK